MLLSVSAKTLKVKLIMLDICKLQTRDKPIKFVLSVPTLAIVVITPKYPAVAIVSTEKRSVTRLIHLVAMFWFTVATIKAF